MNAGASSRFDWPAIRAGAGVCLVFAIPFSLLARWAANSRDDSGLAILLTLGALGGFVLGSGVAAWVQQVGLPLFHGLVTASGTYLGAQAVFIVIRLLTGREVRWYAALFNVAPVLFAGVIGGLLGQLLQRRGVMPSSARALAPGSRRRLVTVLVIDIGTTGVRSAVMHPDATLGDVHYRHLPPATPFPGLVEFDPIQMADVAIELANDALDQFGAEVMAVGVTAQRASTVVWDRATGQPIGPGLGWQDLRTVVACITAKAEHGFALAPNQSATKVAWLLDSVEGARDRDLCFGTVDSWIAWRLTGGAVHVTDRSNAAISGLALSDCSDWNDQILSAFRIPRSMMPTMVDSSGPIAPATALHGAPVLAALVGDQQGSLVGQSCVRRGDTKITFGTGGMLDVCHDADAPHSAGRGQHGTFPIVAWSIDGTTMWGVEGIMLSAGTNIEWLRDDMGLIESAADSHDVARRCASADGVVYVPALLGLGTPHWDYGARGSLFGLTRGTERAHVVRAVLEGIAHRGADLVEAAEADTGHAIGMLRVDGGMSRNPTFVQALADATQRVVEIAPVADATTMGAGYLAGLSAGVWTSLDDVAAMWRPAATIEPGASLDRRRWADAVGRASRWIPELSALDF